MTGSCMKLDKWGVTTTGTFVYFSEVANLVKNFLVVVWATSKGLLLKRAICSGDRTWWRITERNQG